MKKSPKLSTLRNKADRKLQEFIKKTFPFCEVCGKLTQVGHHIYPKSVSNRLRYELDNIARICNGCHMRHHQANDPRIHETIIRKRGGEEWFANLTKKKNEYQAVNKGFYEEAINKFK